MGYSNVSERRRQPPQVGVSVVILALGPSSVAPIEPHVSDNEETGVDTENITAEPHGRLWMPLVRRIREPYLGMWALPGGELRADRSLEQCAYEALESTTDLHPRYLEQLHTFGGPSRSRGGLPMVSIVYWALVGQAETRDFAEADNVKWFPENALPSLAFDHRTIIDHALRRLRERIEYPDLTTRLVGPEFTLRQLHDVAEAVTGAPVDLANFRRRMLASGQLEETGQKVRIGRQRPATVYRYVPDADSHSDATADAVTDSTAALLRSAVAHDSDDSLDAVLGPLTTD